MSRLADDPRRFGRVAVLMGGDSAEREISLRSGNAVLGALRSAGVDARALDPAGENFFRELSGGGYDRVFIALHGRGGEDGVMQGLLDVLGLPYTGSGVLGSALAMDKLRSKQVWAGMGLPTPAFVMLHSVSDLPAAQERLGFPMMLKPVHEGSSIGMAKVEREADLHKAWRDADRYDHEVLAERWIEGPEFTAAIVGDTVLPLIRLETPREFYDYQAKYEADSTQYHCPCGLPQDQEVQLQSLARQAFDALGAAGAWGKGQRDTGTKGRRKNRGIKVVGAEETSAAVAAGEVAWLGAFMVSPSMYLPPHLATFALHP